MLTFEAIQQLFIYKSDTFNTLYVFHIREMAGWRWIAFSSYGVIKQGYKTVIDDWDLDEETEETVV